MIINKLAAPDGRRVVLQQWREGLPSGCLVPLYLSSIIWKSVTDPQHNNHHFKILVLHQHGLFALFSTFVHADHAGLCSHLQMNLSVELLSRPGPVSWTCRGRPSASQPKVFVSSKLNQTEWFVRLLGLTWGILPFPSPVRWCLGWRGS